MSPPIPTPLHAVLVRPEIPHNTGAIGRTRSLYETAFEPGDTLVFGSESAGLPEPFYERYRDALVRIPMPGEHARSLNLANAASIALYEAYRQIVPARCAGNSDERTR